VVNNVLFKGVQKHRLSSLRRRRIRPGHRDKFSPAAYISAAPEFASEISPGK
jgi:hypothetical protein